MNELPEWIKESNRIFVVGQRVCVHVVPTSSGKSVFFNLAEVLKNDELTTEFLYQSSERAKKHLAEFDWGIQRVRPNYGHHADSYFHVWGTAVRPYTQEEFDARQAKLRWNEWSAEAATARGKIGAAAKKLKQFEELLKMDVVEDSVRDVICESASYKGRKRELDHWKAEYERLKECEPPKGTYFLTDIRADKKYLCLIFGYDNVKPAFQIRDLETTPFYLDNDA